MDGGNTAEPATPTSMITVEQPMSNSINAPPPKRDQTQLRKQIVSVGKQPKAQSRKKKDMVSELFDSLTPAAEYFASGTRRKRGTTKAYSIDDYDLGGSEQVRRYANILQYSLLELTNLRTSRPSFRLP